MAKVKMPAGLRARLVAAGCGAALAAAVLPFAPAWAQGERDIPSPEAEAGGNQGDFPPAPAVYDPNSPAPAGGDESGAAAAGQSGENPPPPTPPVTNAAPQSGAQDGGAPLWPSVAAAAAQPGQAPGSEAPSPQMLRDVQNRLQTLESRVDRLELQLQQAKREEWQRQAQGGAGQSSALGTAAAQALPPAAAAQARADKAAAGEEDYAVPADVSADALYRLGQDFMAQGRYGKAVLVWRAFAARFGEDARAAQAGFNLGECYYARGLYGQAAEAYLNVRNRYKDAEIAPQNLLRLAQSMANLGDSQTACGALDALAHEYPRAGGALLDQAAAESGRLQCP